MRKLLLLFVCKQNKTGYTNEAQAYKILPLTILDEKHLNSFGYRLLYLTLLAVSCNSTFGVLTVLWDRSARDHGSVPGRNIRAITSQKPPNRH